mmetsp:Transcript_70673/g.218533  ORF Transcript_70673/g.218533 Transcript_70673/m.218533 type:complete len:222 (+) Transcript_70673:27-692(+)
MRAHGCSSAKAVGRVVVLCARSDTSSASSSASASRARKSASQAQASCAEVQVCSMSALPFMDMLIMIGLLGSDVVSMALTRSSRQSFQDQRAGFSLERLPTSPYIQHPDGAEPTCLSRHLEQKDRRQPLQPRFLHQLPHEEQMLAVTEKPRSVAARWERRQTPCAQTAMRLCSSSTSSCVALNSPAKSPDTQRLNCTLNARTLSSPPTKENAASFAESSRM